MKTGESTEDYLEAILKLGREGSPVRSIDVANELDYSKPSVSVAMKNLRQAGHITMNPHGLINLTESGRKIAESVYERHVMISSWLMSLGVDGKTASNDACRLEHAISEESFLAVKNFVSRFPAFNGSKET